MFEFHGKGKVTLSDRGKSDFYSSKEAAYLPQVVVADAVKWVRVR